MAIENWQKMVGLDRRSTMTFKKPEDCQQLCANTSSCLSWTFKKTAGNGVNGVGGNDMDHCLLKANMEKMTPNSDFVSGSKNCTFAGLQGHA